MASNDPYAALGVKRDASADEIRRAYRALAKKHHPDLNPGDAAAEARFKDIAAAADLLEDADKRARFDRGEIDATGAPAPERSFYRGYAEGEGAARYRGGVGDEAELGDIFGEFFNRQAGAGGARAGAGMRMRGRDQRYELGVDFLDAVNGATRRLGLPDGRDLDVVIPPGIEDGQALRLRGQGGPGAGGGPAGDALITVGVLPHPFFRREGADLHVALPVSLREAVLGAKVTVPTPRGSVAMTIPPRSDAGRQLRLRGRGVAAHGHRAAGDLYATLQVVIGPVDEALEAFLKDWAAAPGEDPRAAMLEATQ